MGAGGMAVVRWTENLPPRFLIFTSGQKRARFFDHQHVAHVYEPMGRDACRTVGGRMQVLSHSRGCAIVRLVLRYVQR